LTLPIKHFNKEEARAYWIESSDQDFKTLNDLFRTKNYSWALFLGHLVVEKLLKACYVSSKNEHAPMIHNLLKLAERAGMEISPNKKEILDTITSFNLSVRYDTYKQEFYRRCTRSFTEEWMAKIKSLRKWIKEKQLQ
jgi:HEPN domain-containing protein